MLKPCKSKYPSVRATVAVIISLGISIELLLYPEWGLPPPLDTRCFYWGTPLTMDSFKLVNLKKGVSLAYRRGGGQK